MFLIGFAKLIERLSRSLVLEAGLHEWSREEHGFEVRYSNVRYWLTDVISAAKFYLPRNSKPQSAFESQKAFDEGLCIKQEAPMCDYSLQNVASRPAKVGDKLISTGFPQTSTRGFAAIDDRRVAVCLLPGTELSFEADVKYNSAMMFPRKVEHRVAKFNKINAGTSHHRDALEFPDGQVVLLTNLCSGQHATVLQLPAGLCAPREKSSRQETTAHAQADIVQVD